MRQTLTGCFWQESQCGEMIAAATRSARVPFTASSFPASGPEACCSALGLECERIAVLGETMIPALRRLAPGVLSIPGHGYLLLVGWRGSSARMLTPSRKTKRVRIEALCDLMLEQTEEAMRAEIDRLLESAGVPNRRRARAARSILVENLSRRQAATGWQIQTSPGASFWQQLRDAGMARRLLIFGGAHFGEVACLVAAWIAVGRGALSGRTDAGWLIAWALLLLTTVPLRLLTTWSQGLLAVAVGGLLKQRLLVGALALDPDAVRGQGTGQLLGRVLEAEALESLALSGGMAALLSLFEASVALAIMALGAVPVLQPLVYGAWIALVGVLACVYGRSRLRWTDARLAMTQGLVERMAGHRTRLAQQRRELWHRTEDEEMDAYLALSCRLDLAGSALRAFPARGWLLIGLMALTVPLLSTGVQRPELAISLGGMLLGYQALVRFSSGASQLAGAFISWRQVSPIFRQAKPEARGRADALAAGPGSSVVIEAQALSYRYPRHIEPALHGCDLRICRGDMVLLEGSSGCGKSTLAAILVGLASPIPACCFPAVSTPRR